MIHVLAEIRRTYGAKLVFRKPGRGPHLFDLVWGTRRPARALQGSDGRHDRRALQPALDRLSGTQNYLLYD